MRALKGKESNECQAHSQAPRYMSVNHDQYKEVVRTKTNECRILDSFLQVALSFLDDFLSHKEMRISYDYVTQHS